MDLRNAIARIVLIAALVGVGAWNAKFPEDFARALPQLRLGVESGAEKGIESNSLVSFIYCKRVCWSSDGRKLLSVTRGDCGLDGPLAVHDLDNAPLRMPIDMLGETVSTAVLASDGRHVLVAAVAADGTDVGRLWWLGLQSDERKLLLETTVRSGVNAIAISGNGNMSAAATSDGQIYLCDPESPVPAILAAGMQSLISDLRFSLDGQRLVSAGQDGWLTVWDLPSRRVLHRWKGHDQPAMAAAFLSGDRLISAGLDDAVRVWEISTGREIWSGEFKLSGVHALAVSGDGKTAAWGGRQSKVVVWDLENASKKYELDVLASIVWDVEFSADSRFLAVAGTQGILRLYDAWSGSEISELEVGRQRL